MSSDFLNCMPKVTIVNTLLELEYSNYEQLQQQLTKELLAIDTIGLRASDYHGFNYKAKVVRKRGSATLKAILRRYPKIDYVIGYVTSDQETIDHERRHYRYFKDPDYKQLMDHEFSKPKHKQLLDQLRKLGYRESVILDEAQAHYKNIVD